MVCFLRILLEVNKISNFTILACNFRYNSCSGTTCMTKSRVDASGGTEWLSGGGQ